MAKVTRADLKKLKARADEHDLFKHLDYYERQAKKLLMRAGYMTAQGEWEMISDPLDGTWPRHVMEETYGGLPKRQRARFLKFPEKVGKLKPVFKQAEKILLQVDIVRGQVKEGNAERAALEMHDLMLAVFKVRGKQAAAFGGAGKLKSRQAIKEAALKLLQEGYTSTDVAWEH